MKYIRYSTLVLAIILSFNAFYSIAENKDENKTNIVLPQQDTPTISIHEASMTGNIEELNKHIAAGTNINEIEPSGGSTPLITASLFGQSDAVSLLLENGADINYRNNDGSTALHTAAFFCHTDVVKVLLEKGAKTDIKNNSGSTPLQSVIVPMEAVIPVYQYFSSTLGPLGLAIDIDQIRETRPVVAELLKSSENK